jgi:hypothetical protein
MGTVNFFCHLTLIFDYFFGCSSRLSQFNNYWIISEGLQHNSEVQISHKRIRDHFTWK